MTKPSYTSGPWVCITDTPKSKNWIDVRQVDTKELVAKVKSNRDCKLIMAAPDLYETLESIADFLASLTVARSLDAEVIEQKSVELFAKARVTLNKATD